MDNNDVSDIIGSGKVVAVHYSVLLWIDKLLTFAAQCIFLVWRSFNEMYVTDSY